MARKRKTKLKARYKLWLVLVLAAIVAVQIGYFSGAIPFASHQTVVPKPAQSFPGVSSQRLPTKPNPNPAPSVIPQEQAAIPSSEDPHPEALEQPRQSNPAITPSPLISQPQTPVEEKRRLPASAYAGAVVRWVLPVGEEKQVALTFDDGPWPDTTAVLDVLRQYGVKATFFWVGLHLQKRPEIARQVVAEGHAIGNHTWSHRNTPMTPEEAGAEIERTAALIQQTTGLTTSLFRPPGGRLYNGLADYALQQGYTVVQWSVLSEDTQAQGSATIVDNVLRNVKPGSIVLLHDGGGDRSHTVEALHSILPSLQAQGYRFVTVPQLLESSQATLPKTSSN